MICPKAPSLTEGQWWEKNYSGPPLVSFVDEVAHDIGLKIGDSVTVNVLGREVTAQVANFRKVNWRTMGINFVMVFSPNTLKSAPHSHVVTIEMEGGDEAKLLNSMAREFPSVTAVRVKEALATVSDLLGKMLGAIRGANALTLLTGILVLAGALAAGLSNRIYDAVVLKTYGASRAQLMGCLHHRICGAGPCRRHLRNCRGLPRLLVPRHLDFGHAVELLLGRGRHHRPSRHAHHHRRRAYGNLGSARRKARANPKKRVEIQGGSRYSEAMVVLNRIYTRTGDKGDTALGSGTRVSKAHLRIQAYGTVDETNAVLGIVRLHTNTEAFAKLDAMLARIQNELFDLGADLCVPDTGEKLSYEPLRILPQQVDRLESEIDDLNQDLAPLRSFVLPGGHVAAAHLHLARTICRRAERLIVELKSHQGEHVSDGALTYINRLSDFLFVASRWANAKTSGDILWVPGKTR